MENMSFPIASYIDHTFLKPTASLADIEKICAEAVAFSFATVCIPPFYVRDAKRLTLWSNVKTCTVIGFPFGYSATEAKRTEIILAIESGADELDVVINLCALKNKDWQYLSGEIDQLLPVVKQHGRIIKLIIESGVLTNDEIVRCCTMYGETGVDFLKTSTGYAETGGTVAAVELMRRHLPDQVRIKASGGIRSLSFARALIGAGASRLGCSASLAIVAEENQEST
jgi:deoxyribose-phosphate aldolase